jgi:imidazolonepropionase
MILIHNAAQLVTPLSNGRFLVLENAAVVADRGIIEFVGSTSEALASYPAAEKVNAKGKVLLPGFVDPHTHLIFGGDRCHEFMMRLEGATYQQIAASGGGIQHTVRGTREASEDNLFNTSMRHIQEMIRYGTTTVEVKSGYGLNLQTEMKLLKVARRLSDKSGLDVVRTFLGAHDLPQEKSRTEYIDEIKNHMLPAVAREELAEFCDVFCDQGYYSIEETRDIALSAVSADHLILANDYGIKKMAEAGVIAVLLPGTSFALKVKQHAPARKMIDAGVRIALATDFNPGTCFSHSMQYVLQLACLLYGLNPEEALTAATLNAAAAIHRDRVLGSLETGKQMDCLMFDVPHYGYLFYNLGVNHLMAVFKKGKNIWNRNSG